MSVSVPVLHHDESHYDLYRRKLRQWRTLTARADHQILKDMGKTSATGTTRISIINDGKAEDEQRLVALFLLHGLDERAQEYIDNEPEFLTVDSIVNAVEKRFRTLIALQQQEFRHKLKLDAVKQKAVNLNEHIRNFEYLRSQATRLQETVPLQVWKDILLCGCPNDLQSNLRFHEVRKPAQDIEELFTFVKNVEKEMSNPNNNNTYSLLQTNGSSKMGTTLEDIFTRLQGEMDNIERLKGEMNDIIHSRGKNAHTLT